jgi:hypothetical protein
VLRIVLSPFLLLSAVGLVLSLVVLVSALFGYPAPLGERGWVLHVGIFVVWIPAVLVMQRLTREFKQKDVWRAALRGCPRWMRRMVYGFGVYALVNFAIFIFMQRQNVEERRETPAIVFRGFSGHWMAFYAAAFGILYSALQVQELDEQRRCGNGHPMSPAAKFCEECGEPAVRHTTGLDT